MAAHGELPDFLIKSRRIEFNSNLSQRGLTIAWREIVVNLEDKYWGFQLVKVHSCSTRQYDCNTILRFLSGLTAQVNIGFFNLKPSADWSQCNLSQQ